MKTQKDIAIHSFCVVVAILACVRLRQAQTS